MTDSLPALAIAVPILAAAVTAGIGGFLSRRTRDALTLVAALATLAVCVTLLDRTSTHEVVQWLGSWRPRHGIAVGVDLAADPIGAGAATFAAALTVVAAVLSA